jgi:hypothetical protein
VPIQAALNWIEGGARPDRGSSNGSGRCTTGSGEDGDGADGERRRSTEEGGHDR